MFKRPFLGRDLLPIGKKFAWTAAVPNNYPPIANSGFPLLLGDLSAKVYLLPHHCIYSKLSGVLSYTWGLWHQYLIGNFCGSSHAQEFFSYEKRLQIRGKGWNVTSPAVPVQGDEQKPVGLFRFWWERRRFSTSLFDDFPAEPMQDLMLIDSQKIPLQLRQPLGDNSPKHGKCHGVYVGCRHALSWWSLKA